MGRLPAAWTAKFVPIVVALSLLATACQTQEVYTISGRVSGSWQCVNIASSRMPTMITLQPLDWTAPFSHEEPRFSFSNVGAGDYTLEVSCAAPGGTFPGMPVSITATDVDVEVVLPYPNLPIRRPAAELAGHQGAVLSLAFSRDGLTLISGGEDGALTRWNVSSGEPLETVFHGQTDATLPLVLSGDGALLASGASDGAVRLWGVQSGELRHTLAGLENRPQGIAFTPNGEIVVAWEEGESGRAVLWDVADGERIHSIDLSSDQRLPQWARKAILFDPDGTSLIAVVPLDREWRVEWWDVATGMLLKSVSPPVVEWVTLSTAHSASRSPDGTRFAFGMAGLENRGSLVIWEPETGRSSTGRYSLSVDRVSFSPDGATVASSAFDNTVVLWNAATGEATNVLVSDGRGVDAFAWSPDGKMLAAADGEGRILLWEVP